MISIAEEQGKDAPGALALIQAFVNTHFGQGRREHTELKYPDELGIWLVQRDLLADGSAVSEGDFRRFLQLRDALRDLLRANNEGELLASQVEMLNHLAHNAPLIVQFESNGRATLEPDISGVDGALAHLLGIVFTSMKDETWSRLKVCRNDRCQKAFYDISKNHSGAWCSMARCGSRIKANSYRQRREAHGE